MLILKQGNTGPYVEMLQLALKRAGYLTGKIDGIFGPLTKSDLIKYQKDYGLLSDGIMGEKTFNSIKQYITGYGIYSAKRGEEISSIAKKFNSTEFLIKTANPTLSGNLIPSALKIVIPYRVTVATSDISYTALLVSLICDGLIKRYPFIKGFSYGKSVLGRNLQGLKIGNGKNQLMANAAHHANEWITIPVLLRFCEDYAKAYSQNTKILNYNARELFELTSFTLLPLVNPDGVDLVTGAIPDSSEIYEKAEALNYTNLPFPSAWKANIAGTDLNLNYPAGWEKAKEIKYSQGYTSPAPRDFVGFFPLSAPESRAVYNLTKQNDYQITLSYHTQGETIYWKYADYLPEYSEEIAAFFSKVSGYLYEVTPEASGYAGYKDWFIMNYNRPGYTIEAGLGINPLPLSQFDKIYEANLPILAGAAAIVSKGR